MPGSWLVCYLEGDRIKVPGVSFGYGDSDPFLVARSPFHVLLRKPGAREWSQLGSTAYFPAKWKLWRVRWLDEECFCTEELLERREPGRSWQRAKQELLMAMKKADQNAKEV